MQDPTKPLIVDELKNNQKTMPSGGFNAHPENINRNGRPKNDWTWKELLDEVAEEYIEVNSKKGGSTRQQYKKLVAKKLFHLAVNGNVGAAKELMNRRDGMPKQQTELSGNVEIVTHRAPVEKP